MSEKQAKKNRKTEAEPAKESPPDLGINVEDEFKLGELLHNYKLWFNGGKKFSSIKTLPIPIN